MNVTGPDLVQVVAIVPFSTEPGRDEVLALRGDGSFSLPNGPRRRGERLLDAAARIVAEQAGFLPEPVRLVYLLESRTGALFAGVHCNLPADLDDSNDLRGEFITLSQSVDELEPMALAGILVEDLRSGFVRPVAHLVESVGNAGPSVHITW